MKKLFIIANWKSNKTIEETEKWLHDFSEALRDLKPETKDKKIIIAPPFISLEHTRYCAGNLRLPVEYASQNISPFDDGAYTGEVSGRQIKEVASYVIVGHSERRKHFKEDDNTVNKKLDQAFKHELTPILCISDLEQISNFQFPISNFQLIVAYEPLFAIGSGKPDTPENADKMTQSIKKVLGSIPVLYGGSVTAENVQMFTNMPNIDGALVGGASLEPHRFAEIVKNA
jgi:triosephosphate isomerase (TIM)